jgi:glycosyltransferase involved in cell wall biosynthesis
MNEMGNRMEQQTTSTTPLVSVLTPTYNRADFLAETIDSVLAQTYPNIEYIVIDDGSTDNTQEILNRYSTRLTWHTHPNMGETRTVNKGWALTHGEYIIVVNSDDPIFPHTIETMVAFMEAHPDVLVSYPDWQIIDKESREVGVINALSGDVLDMLRYCACFPGPGALMRRKVLHLEPERDTRYKYVADFEYWLRVGLHGSLARVPQVLATHRTHPDSAGVKVNAKIGQELITLTREFFRRPNIPPHVQSVRRQAISAAYNDAGERIIQSQYVRGLLFLVLALLIRPRLRHVNARYASMRRIRDVSAHYFPKRTHSNQTAH